MENFARIIVHLKTFIAQKHLGMYVQNVVRVSKEQNSYSEIAKISFALKCAMDGSKVKHMLARTITNTRECLANVKRVGLTL